MSHSPRSWSALLALLLIATPACVMADASAPPSTNMDALIRRHGLDDFREEIHSAAHGRGQLEESHGRWAEAADAYERALAAAPEDVDLALAVTRVAHALGEPSRAARALQTTLRHRPQDATLMAAMGRTLWAQGDMDHASAWLQQAWDLDPSSPALTADLITVLLLAERSDDALDLGQLVDDELPAELCLALGRAALANDPERASPFLARYLDAWPRDTDAWLDLARAQLLVDAPGPARLSAEQALSLRADDVDGLRLLGLALMGLDRPLDARRPLRQALTLGAPRGLVGPMLDRLDQLVEAEQRDASDEPAP